MKKNEAYICKEFTKSISMIDDISKFVIEKINENDIKYILLSGEIGSGKTTFVKSFAKLLKEKKGVISPTFNKMFVYDKFVHIDAYNMNDFDFESLKDYFDDKFVLIEWPSNLNNFDFDTELKIDIKWENEDDRNYFICWKENQ